MIVPQIQKMIDYLRSVDTSPSSNLAFDMNTTYEMAAHTGHPCGSACCIGGHAQFLLASEGKSVPVEIEEALAKFAGIDTDAANLLCWPGMKWMIRYEPVSLETAIEVLEHYRDTGVVDWSKEQKRQQLEDMLEDGDDDGEV